MTVRELDLLIAQAEVDAARVRGEQVSLCLVCLQQVADPLLFGHELRHQAEAAPVVVVQS